MMFKLDDYVDVKTIFEALETLPVQLAVARHGVFVADAAHEEATRELGVAEWLKALRIMATGAENSGGHEEPEWGPWQGIPSVTDGGDAVRKAAGELAQARDALANLQDKFSAVRNTIRMAQTVGALQFADAVDLAARLREEADATWDDEIPF